MLHLSRLGLASLFFCIILSACSQNGNGPASIPYRTQQLGQPVKQQTFTAKSSSITISEYGTGTGPQSISIIQGTFTYDLVWFLTAEGLNDNSGPHSDPRFGPYNANTDIGNQDPGWFTAPCIKSVPGLPGPQCQPGDVMFLGGPSSDRPPPYIFQPVVVAGHNEPNHIFPTRFNLFGESGNHPDPRTVWIIGGSVNPKTLGSQVEEAEVSTESIVVRRDLPSPHCNGVREGYIATDIEMPFIAATSPCHGRHERAAVSVVLQIDDQARVVKTFRVPDAESITPFSAHGLLITQPGKTNAIGRLNTSTGKLTEFRLPTPNAGPQQGVMFSGELWFTEKTASKIGVFDPFNGAIVEYATPTRDAQPWGIATFYGCPTGAPYGSTALFFTEYKANKIGEVVITPESARRT